MEITEIEKAYAAICVSVHGCSELKNLKPHEIYELQHSKFGDLINPYVLQLCSKFETYNRKFTKINYMSEEYQQFIADMISKKYGPDHFLIHMVQNQQYE